MGSGGAQGFPWSIYSATAAYIAKQKCGNGKRKRRGTASYLLFTSLDHTASNQERQAQTSTRNTVRPQAESLPTAFA